MRLKGSKKARHPTVNAKRPLRVKELQKLLQECVWRRYRATRCCCKRCCLKRKNYYVHVPMSQFTVVSLRDACHQSPVSWPDFLRDYWAKKAESEGPYLVTMPVEGVEITVYTANCGSAFTQLLVNLRLVFPTQYLVHDEAGRIREDAIKFPA